MDQTAHWSVVAHQWSLLGPPLRPSEADLDGFRRGMGGFEKPRVALFGATMELYRLPWPEGTHWAIVDNNVDILNAVWAGPRDMAIRADWRSLPLAPSSRDLVMCDGGLTLVPYPVGYESIVDCLWKTLASGGAALFRVHIRPSLPESHDAVLDDLLAARIPSLNHLKIRLGTALQTSTREGVVLDAIWNALHRVAPDLRELAERLGWDFERLQVIEDYRDNPYRFRFPELFEIQDVFEHRGFRMEWANYPDYVMGERSPVLCFRRP